MTKYQHKAIHHLVITLLVIACVGCEVPESTKQSPTQTADDHFLDRIQRAGFRYFWDRADPDTGLIQDTSRHKFASTASIGFGLSAMVMAHKRQFRNPEDIERRVLAILKTLRRSPKKHGCPYHYLDLKTGGISTKGYEKVASTVDTALLLMGVITCGEYFDGEIRAEAEKLVADMNWRAFYDPKRGSLSMGWKTKSIEKHATEGEILKPCWNWFTDEAILCTLLAIAAPKEEHRIPPEAFYRWKRPMGKYVPRTPGLQPSDSFVYSWTGCLFTYQFAHCWIDFRRLGPDDPGKFGLKNVPAVDWHANARNATLAARLFCIDRQKEFRTFGPDSWGLTACAWHKGYLVAGPIPCGRRKAVTGEGTIAPYGAASSITLTPKESIAALRHYYNLRDKDGKRLVWQDEELGGYGFWDSFNLDRDVVTKVIIGIDVGPMIVAIENYRTGLIQKTFMKNTHIRDALKRIGFRAY